MLIFPSFLISFFPLVGCGSFFRGRRTRFQREEGNGHATVRWYVSKLLTTRSKPLANISVLRNGVHELKYQYALTVAPKSERTMNVPC